MSPSTKPPLPTNLYSAQATRQLDSIAINEFNIAGYELMKRAGAAVFDYVQNHYPLAKHILVCCGAGNNAGDGYVVAKLALQAGLDVSVISLVDTDKLQGDAKTAWQDWHSSGHQLLECSDELLQQADVIIDAILGTGLQREVEGEWASLIEQINHSAKPIIAVDIPSGLEADTGRVMGQVVKAVATVTFIGLKKGLLTHHGVDYCGELIFDDLAIPPAVYSRQPAQAELLNWPQLKKCIQPRKASAHKQQCGHLLILGGDMGMPGSVRMAAEAALRIGAGLVTVVTHAEHMSVVLSDRPEIMLHSTDTGHIAQALLSRASAIVVGPGLTDSQWSQNILASVLDSHAPKVLDAGALRLLSEEDDAAENSLASTQAKNWVLTPHPGEAAALLGESSACIQDSRFSSVELLQQKYSGHIVLKGAGSLVQSPGEITQLCPYGNPGMASAGMGDVLSGVIGGLLAQGYDLTTASQLGVCIHSIAGDRASQKGQVGLLASDLFPCIRELMNTHD